MEIRTPLLITCILLFSASTPVISFADSNCKIVNVAAAKIPHFIESNNRGVFINLVREGAIRAGLELTISVFPKKRALMMFKTGEVAALIPHSNVGERVAAYKSTPLFIKRDFAFVRGGTPIPDSIDALEGLSVGLTAQYAYPKSLTSNKKIIFGKKPNSDTDNIKMLSMGRHDVSIIEEHSGLKAISEAGVKNIVYDPRNPISEILVWMLFSKNDCGKNQSEKINAAFSSMKTDGIWTSIMKQSQNEN